MDCDSPRNLGQFNLSNHAPTNFEQSSLDMYIIRIQKERKPLQNGQNHHVHMYIGTYVYIYIYLIYIMYTIYINILYICIYIYVFVTICTQYLLIYHSNPQRSIPKSQMLGKWCGVPTPNAPRCHAVPSPPRTEWIHRPGGRIDGDFINFNPLYGIFSMTD